MKVSNEHIAGLIQAIKLSVEEENSAKRLQDWNERLDLIRRSLVPVPNVRIEVLELETRGSTPQIPRLSITVDGPNGHEIAGKLRQRLSRGNPQIFTRDPKDSGCCDNSIVLETRCLEKRDIPVLVRRLNQSLRSLKSKRSSDRSAQPSVD